jgi:hypothetical protein
MSDNNELVISENNAHDVIKEIEEAFYDIPFENSAFQTENFVIAAQLTPERAYRAIGLKLMKKLITVQEAILDSEKSDINVEELKEKINSSEYSIYEKKRFEIDIKKKHINDPFSKKLLNDAIVEINLLYKHFKSLPRYTREQFEAGEKLHYLESLNRQALGFTGAKESLLNLTEDIEGLKSFTAKFTALENKSDSDVLRLITNDMSNIKTLALEKKGK